jgi:hypothetical protein
MATQRYGSTRVEPKKRYPTNVNQNPASGQGLGTAQETDQYNLNEFIEEVVEGYTFTDITVETLTATTAVVTDTISEETSAAGVTVDGVLLKDGGVTANSQIAAFYPQVAQNNIAAATGGAIIVTNYLTTINTDAGGDAFTLANGTQIGQMKKILLVVDGGGDATITVANLSGGTTITMGDATDFIILQWNGTTWIPIENFGTAIA